jgi:CheY-like chemotaxis protein
MSGLVKVLVVSDRGIESEQLSLLFSTASLNLAGMDMETVQRVFEPFFTTKNTGSGSGLGLSMVRGIVTSHGGFMRVESRLGQGSRFDVFLPLSRSTADLEAVPVVTLSTWRQDRSREKILVIDDDEEIANLAVRILRSHAYKAEAILEPRDAIERLRSSPHEFALVLTDLMMDDLSGRDVVRELKMINPDVPVVLVSGCASILSEEAAHQEGFAAVIHKPFGSEQLASDVAEVLGRVNGL